MFYARASRLRWRSMRACRCKVCSAGPACRATCSSLPWCRRGLDIPCLSLWLSQWSLGHVRITLRSSRSSVISSRRISSQHCSRYSGRTRRQRQTSPSIWAPTRKVSLVLIDQTPPYRQERLALSLHCICQALTVSYPLGGSHLWRKSLVR